MLSDSTHAEIEMFGGGGGGGGGGGSGGTKLFRFRLIRCEYWPFSLLVAVVRQTLCSAVVTGLLILYGIHRFNMCNNTTSSNQKKKSSKN